MAAVDLATKQCTKCGETKQLTEFTRHPRGAGGRKSWCKPCIREYTRDLRKDPGYKVRDRVNSDAYAAALYALRDAHRDEFDVLLAAERKKRRLD